ncbi:MAG: amylo-alpha-1,6-glucosidase [Patescibacteria group bacterium]|nr:amylo-alpha-1,6-glucosidase [Patescibacteria group bacterium]
MNQKTTNTIETAGKIARKNLQSCYLNKKVLASPGKFSDYWARDTFWAMAGMLAVGDFEIAKSSLEFFLKYQREDGKIPRKVILEWDSVKYLFGKKIKRNSPKPVYTGIVRPFHSMDDNSLLVIAAREYIKKSGNFKFAEENYIILKKTIDWYESKLSRGLIKEFFLSNWMDTIFKFGKVLYTNVLYCEALNSMREIALTAKRNTDSEYYFEKSENVKGKINDYFWNGEFYNDQPGRRIFDSAGNILACYFGIAPRIRVRKVLDRMEKIKGEKVLLPTVNPRYSIWRVNPLAIIFGLPEYHNGVSWLWIDLLAVIVKHRSGRREEALKDLERIAEIIIKQKTVYETYFNDGRPFKKIFWKSEASFAWNSGIFLQTCDLIAKKRL